MVYLREHHQLSIQQACLLVHLARSMYYYRSVDRSDHELITVLEQLALDHPRYGFRKMFFTLRNQGHKWNHKKVYRVYCLLGLNLKRKAKRRLPTRIKEPLEVPDAPHQVWSIDFMSHSLYDGRRFRVLNIIDDFNREALWMEIDTSIGSLSVVEIIGLVVRETGKPLQIRVDNGPEFISSTFTHYCNKNNIEIKYIQPGKPTQNAFIERFNGSFRREVLSAYIFYNLRQVQKITEIWRANYNNTRPHEALGNKAPVEYLKSKFSTFQQNRLKV